MHDDTISNVVILGAGTMGLQIGLLSAISGFDVIIDFVEQGSLGIKTGKGFYTYPDPDFLKPEFMEGIR